MHRFGHICINHLHCIDLILFPLDHNYTDDNLENYNTHRRNDHNFYLQTQVNTYMHHSMDGIG